MNSSGAPVFQADHSRLFGVKGKGKGKGAHAASLAGSLFSLIPGAVVQRAQGFGSMLRQLRGDRPGPGIQLTRPPAIAGQSPTGGGDRTSLPVVAFNRRETGAANTPVLRLGEVIRDPQSPQSTEGIRSPIQGVPAEGILSQAVPQVESGDLADASLKASKLGSEADFPDPGQTPGARPALHIPSRTGEVKVAGKPAEPSGVGTGAGVVTDARPSGVPPVVTLGVTAAGSQPEPEEISQSSRLAGVSRGSPPSGLARSSVNGQTRDQRVAGNNPSGVPSSGTARQSRSLQSYGGSQTEPARDQRGAGDNQPAVPGSRVIQSSRVFQPDGGDRSGAIRPHADHRTSDNRMEVHSEPSHSSSGGNGKAKGSTSGIVSRQPHPHVPLNRPETVETEHQGAGGSAAAGRVTNQRRLDSNPSLPDRLEEPTAAPQTSGRASPSRPSEQQPASHRVTPVRAGGQHSTSAAQGEGTMGSGSHPANNLTNQGRSQHPAPDGDGISRDFVKPVSLGVQKSGEHMGHESPAPVTHSLPTPAPPPAGETSANLASLARMTVLLYSRFVGGEQRGSVFTFNGGSLGNVQLTFQESNAGTTLHIVVESLEARHALQRALPNLEQQWTHQGLNFSDVNVEVGDTGHERGFSDQGNLPGTPAIDSTETEEVAIDEESESVRDYGYNTVEFVA